MKQKYTLLKDKDTGGLTIQEHAELSKDMFSLICEESYDAETIQSAVAQSKTVLIDTLRTPNLYPISEYIEEIADKVTALFDASSASDNADIVELVFDDVALFRKEAAPGEIESEESLEIEDLLDDDTEDDEDSDDSDAETDGAPLDLPVEKPNDDSPDDDDSL